MEFVELAKNGLQLVPKHRLRLPQALVLLFEGRRLDFRLAAHHLVLLQPLLRNLHFPATGLPLLRQLLLLGFVRFGELAELPPQLFVLLEEVLTDLELRIHLLLHVLDGLLEFFLQLCMPAFLLLRNALVLLGDARLLLLQFTAGPLKLRLRGERALHLHPEAVPLLGGVLLALLHGGLVLLLAPGVLDSLHQGLVDQPNPVFVRGSRILKKLLQRLHFGGPIGLRRRRRHERWVVHRRRPHTVTAASSRGAKGHALLDRVHFHILGRLVGVYELCGVCVGIVGALGPGAARFARH
mmetsp:Transcript_87061/g.244162  ORF Transcript_87061/g.244162 Transcript_87061/m.244162 type:complete len:296 (+) Transcript_87061:607-1494(+)